MRYTYHITIQKPLRCDGQTLGTHRDTASCASVNEALQFINQSLGFELSGRVVSRPPLTFSSVATT